MILFAFPPTNHRLRYLSRVRRIGNAYHHYDNLRGAFQNAMHKTLKVTVWQRRFLDEGCL